MYHCCKRCLTEVDLYHMRPLSYTMLLCERCLRKWQDRRQAILLAALDLFVSETPQKPKILSPLEQLGKQAE